MDNATLEDARLLVQVKLDSERTADERNEWGQFATPPRLAIDIVERALELHGEHPIHFLEPSIGTGSFYSALRALSNNVEAAIGCELDDRFAQAARDLWDDAGLKVVSGDFTRNRVAADSWASLVVANPPYSRHHHLSAETKSMLAASIFSETGLKVSGLAGLYVHFMLLSHKYLKPGAISAWLIPAEFMDVNFGASLKQYLTNRVRILQIHRYDPEDAQFDDALITSAVVFFENSPPSISDQVRLTRGGTPKKPIHIRSESLSALKGIGKWGPLFRDGFEIVTRDAAHSFGEFFRVSRGLSTGNNKFFIRPLEEARALGISDAHLRPIIASPRTLSGDVIEVDDDGYPRLSKKQALIDVTVRHEPLWALDPAAAAYFETAGSVPDSYTARNRNPWYKQEVRVPAPFLITYMGRAREGKKPFRFFWNKSQAVSTNLMLMIYPKDKLADALEAKEIDLEQVHQHLRAITSDELRDGGRVYGGGLQKMEPSELRALHMPHLARDLGV